MPRRLSERDPARGVTGLILRLPAYLYRAHLGWLLGGRFLLLKHLGRNTGKLRSNVLEVVRHDPDADTFIVASGWGEKSNWYRNTMKTPDVQIVSKSRHLSARAERLSHPAAVAELRGYARRYPRAFRNLAKVLLGPDALAEGDPFESMAEVVPIIALRSKLSPKAPTATPAV